jgi:DNA-binding NarL/FixJ family response regulator
MSPIRVLLADDHQLVRQGLRSLLRHEAGVDVVAEAANGRDAVRLAAALKPDVVLMDIRMPDLNGIEATRQITRRSAGTRVIGLSGHGTPELVGPMFAAGAAGYVPKDSAFDELATALRAVAAGRTYAGPAGAAGLRAEGAGRDEAAAASAASAFASLSPREREVLQLLAEGASTKQVARRLGVGVKTAESHRFNLIRKTGISSIAELTKYAIREGLTSINP